LLTTNIDTFKSVSLMNTPPQSQHDPVLEFIWGQYRTWAATSAKLKRELNTWRAVVLTLTILGALTAILSQQFASMEWITGSKISGWISAAAIGIAGYAGSKILTADKEKNRLKARAAAERCESYVYLYIFKIPPYSKQEDEAALLASVEDLIKSLFDIPQARIAKEAQLKGIPSATFSFENYLQQRIEEQVDTFYFPKAELYRRRMARGSNLGIVLGITGFLLGMLGTSGNAGQFSIWIAFISTVSASVTSFLAVNRYQYLAMSYQVTGSLLKIMLIRGKRIGKDDLPAQQALIRNCEDILSRENEGWLAEFSREEEDSEPE
jgi:hypothetical protein